MKRAIFVILVCVGYSLTQAMNNDAIINAQELEHDFRMTIAEQSALTNLIKVHQQNTQIKNYLEEAKEQVNTHLKDLSNQWQPSQHPGTNIATVQFTANVLYETALKKFKKEIAKEFGSARIAQKSTGRQPTPSSAE